MNMLFQSKSKSLTGAKILVECLRQQDVKNTYLVPGESYLSVLDALTDVPEIELTVCRQEGGAAMMAAAHGKLTGRPGICMVTRGPGATNASAGLHIACQDAIPMILFVGQVAREMREREAFQEIDYRRMFGQVAKWVAEVDSPDRMAEIVSRAFHVAMSGRPGPVVLAVPEDMLTEHTKVNVPNLGLAKPARATITSHDADEFLNTLRRLCTDHGALLIFDEVISGFRFPEGGYGGHVNIEPDITALGKVIGGGLPVGAYGARKKIMDKLSPLGPVYQAGTLSGNPVAMAAGIAQLEECLKPGFYESLASKADSFVNRIQSHADSKGYPFHMFNVGSIFWLSFSNKNRVRSADEIAPDGPELFKVFFDSIIEKGVYVGPSSYEVGFISQAHTEEDLSKAANAIIEALDVTYAK